MGKKNCAVLNCKSDFVKGSAITFHKFPKDENRRKLWEKQLRRKNFKAGNHTKICSKHFTPDSFDVERFGGTWLKKDAIPTIFDFDLPPRLLKQLNPPEPELEPISVIQQKDENVITEKERTDVNPNKNFRLLGNYRLTDMFFPYKAKEMFRIATRNQQIAIAKMLNLMGKSKILKKRVNALRKIHRKIKLSAKAAEEEESKKVIKSLYYASNLTLNDMNSEEKAKEMFMLAIEKQKQVRRRVKILQDTNSRMEKRLDSLKRKINRKKSCLNEKELKILEEVSTSSKPNNEPSLSSLQIPKRRKLEISVPKPLPSFDEYLSFFETHSPIVEELSRTNKQEPRDPPDILATPIGEASNHLSSVSSASNSKDSLSHPIVLRSTIKREPQDSTDIQFPSSERESNNFSPGLLSSGKESPLLQSVVLIREEPLTLEEHL